MDCENCRHLTVVGLHDTGPMCAALEVDALTHGQRGAPCHRVCVGCLTSQQHASVSQGRICSDNSTCCHTEIDVADQALYLTQSQYTDTGPTSPSADPITPCAWQGRRWSVNFEVTGMIPPGKIPSQAGFEPRIFLSRGGRLNHWAKEALLTIQAVVAVERGTQQVVLTVTAVSRLLHSSC